MCYIISSDLKLNWVIKKMERKYLTPKEVEDMLCIHKGTLANWRCQGRGPAYIKYGRKVLYPIGEIEAWLAANRVRTADSPESPRLSA